MDKMTYKLYLISDRLAKIYKNILNNCWKYAEYVCIFDRIGWTYKNITLDNDICWCK